jgi:hypothetical protein
LSAKAGWLARQTIEAMNKKAASRGIDVPESQLGQPYHLAL